MDEFAREALGRLSIAVAELGMSHTRLEIAVARLQKEVAALAERVGMEMDDA